MNLHHEMQKRVTFSYFYFSLLYKLLNKAAGSHDPDDFTIGSEQLNKKKEKLRKFTRLSVEQGMIGSDVEEELLVLLSRI